MQSSINKCKESDRRHSRANVWFFTGDFPHNLLRKITCEVTIFLNYILIGQSQPMRTSELASRGVSFYNILVNFQNCIVHYTCKTNNLLSLILKCGERWKAKQRRQRELPHSMTNVWFHNKWWLLCRQLHVKIYLFKTFTMNSWGQRSMKTSNNS